MWRGVCEEGGHADISRRQPRQGAHAPNFRRTTPAPLNAAKRPPAHLPRALPLGVAAQPPLVVVLHIQSHLRCSQHTWVAGEL